MIELTANPRSARDGGLAQMKPIVHSVVYVVSIALLSPTTVRAQEDAVPAKGIQDNSFLIEEAYNQEPGVVQNIISLRRQGRDTYLTFTQEMPIFTQQHQFSYSIPYSWLRSAGQRPSGIGDVMFNYRFQALSETSTMPAFAPRLSLIVPTGNERKGLGNGSYGYQLNFPVSKIVSERITIHANAGTTSMFNVNGRRPRSFNVGASVVYAAAQNINFLLEAVGERNEAVNAFSRIEREKLLTVSPGARYAMNFTDAQLVFGLGAPVVMKRAEKPSYGLFLYLSYESKLFH